MWLLSSASAFQPPAANLAYRSRHASGLTPRMEAGDISRRQSTTLALAALAGTPAIARAEESKRAYQPALAGKDYGKSEMGGGADFTRAALFDNERIERVTLPELLHRGAEG